MYGHPECEAMQWPRLMVTGMAEHGKDTVCEMLAIPYQSSSRMALEIFLFDLLRDRYGYQSAEECYLDRGRLRDVWHQEIKAFNTPDKARLSREILRRGPIYCGIRCREEFAEARKEGLFDLAVWVDASERLPPEPSTSMSLKRSDCDIVIDNNGTLKQLAERVARLKWLLGRKGPWMSVAATREEVLV